MGLFSQPHQLLEVLNGAVEELMSTPSKIALAPIPADREVIRRIAFYEEEHFA